MQDKEGKVAYLNKMMNVVGIFLGEPVPAKPLKVSVSALLWDSLHAHLHACAQRHVAFAKPCCGCAVAVAMQIVAGVEPDSTNLFLQMLGKAARKGDAADVVQVGQL